MILITLIVFLYFIKNDFPIIVNMKLKHPDNILKLH